MSFLEHSIFIIFILIEFVFVAELMVDAVTTKLQVKTIGNFDVDWKISKLRYWSVLINTLFVDSSHNFS